MGVCVKISSYDYRIVFSPKLSAYFIACILNSVIRCIYIYNYYVFLLNYEKSLFSYGKLFVMKSALSNTIIAAPALCLSSAWHTFSIQFISTDLNPYV